MAASGDGDDLTAGEENKCSSGTQLMVGDANGIGGDYLLAVDIVALKPDHHRVDGIRAEAFGNGIALRGDAHTFTVNPTGDEPAFPPSGTGVQGSGKEGVVGFGTMTGVLGRADDGTGVLAMGHTGLEAVGEANADGGGVGANLVGSNAAAATLESRTSGQAPVVPQLHIEPQKVPNTPRELAQPTQAIEIAGRLPADGQAGDLLMTVDDAGTAALWLCVSGEDLSGDDRTASRWSEVLLGSPVSGEL